ncbi:MAG: CoA transferase [Xanthomonadaceae bacterium]|nr:CoA transferase [Xanthomonadaceae bacterium]
MKRSFADPDDNGPLSGVVVVDVSQMLAAPFAAMLLADFGATVLKIEPPKGDQSRRAGYNVGGTSVWWRQLGRNKYTVTCNLKDERGQALARRIVENADVLVDNMRPGKLEKVGLDPVELMKANPGLITLRVSGWGQDGPYRDLPAFGSQAEAFSGFAYSNGEPDGKPILPAVPLADAAGGYLGAFAVAMALYRREKDPNRRGQVIDVSLLESIFGMLGPWVTAYDELGHIPQRLGGRSPAAVPRNVYLAKDGIWVSVSCATDDIAFRAFRAIGREDMTKDPKFATHANRTTHIAEIDAIMGDWIGRHDSKFVTDAFNEAGVPVAPIYSIKEVVNDPHVNERGMLERVIAEDLGKEIRMQGVFPRLMGTPGKLRWSGRPIGADNEAWYVQRLGLSHEELARLKEEGVI